MGAMRRTQVGRPSFLPAGVPPWQGRGAEPFPRGAGRGPGTGFAGRRSCRPRNYSSRRAPRETAAGAGTEVAAARHAGIRSPKAAAASARVVSRAFENSRGDSLRISRELCPPPHPIPPPARRVSERGGCAGARGRAGPGRCRRRCCGREMPPAPAHTGSAGSAGLGAAARTGGGGGGGGNGDPRPPVCLRSSLSSFPPVPADTGRSGAA